MNEYETLGNGLSFFFCTVGIFFLILFAILIVCWVLWSVSSMKILKAFNYPNVWMAWIPGLNYFALAQLTADENKETTVVKWKIPTTVFSLWFIASLILPSIPGIGALLNTILQTICLGTCFSYIYAKCENKSIKDTQALGYVSGFFPIIALCKFLSYKNEIIINNIKKSDEEIDDFHKENTTEDNIENVNDQENNI